MLVHCNYIPVLCINHFESWAMVKVPLWDWQIHLFCLSLIFYSPLVYRSMSSFFLFRFKVCV